MGCGPSGALGYSVLRHVAEVKETECDSVIPRHQVLEEAIVQAMLKSHNLVILIHAQVSGSANALDYRVGESRHII